jgi:hypothetical protein
MGTATSAVGTTAVEGPATSDGPQTLEGVPEDVLEESEEPEMVQSLRSQQRGQ